MNVILLGLPGAGKGTQAKLIIEHLKIPHISTGDLFRKAYQEKTDLGIMAKEYMSRGELVPDEVTIGIANSRLEFPDCNNGFLLDGFPRNITQAKALKEYLVNNKKTIDHVVYVEVNKELLVERLTGRRVCQDCGGTFHIINNPPIRDGLCNICNGVLIQREDDSEGTVRERLRINMDLTTQLVNYYRFEDCLRIIDGSKRIEEVSEELLCLFNNLGNNR